MNYKEVCESFAKLSERIEKVWLPHIPLKQTVLQIHGWQYPSLTPEDATLLCREIQERFTEEHEDLTKESSTYWAEMSKQADLITFANFTSDPINVIRSTFEFLIVCTLNLPTAPASVDWQRVKSKNYVPRDLARRIGSMEQRLEDLEPRSETLQEKILIIEAAHDAANQLPTDLEELRRSGTELRGLLTQTAKNAGQVERDLEAVETMAATVKEMTAETDLLVKKCQENYRITTSAGLAGAFDERSKNLNITAWVWVVILIASLLGAVWLGTGRLDGFKALLTGSAPVSLIVLNLLIAILGVAGPVWIAWVASKNVGQNFRLAEDYAFKASVSKAYEGYRKEAVNLDIEFAKRLFGSALNRLDEAPSRFITNKDHNSPMEALLDSPALKAILEAFPELKDKLLKYANAPIESLTRPTTKKPSTAAKVAATETPAE